jgi:hypothetical protein
VCALLNAEALANGAPCVAVAADVVQAATPDAALEALQRAAQRWGLAPAAVAGVSACLSCVCMRCFRGRGSLTACDAHRAHVSPVVGGAAAAAHVLSPAHAAGFRAVLLALLSGDRDGDAATQHAALPRAARAADVPRALAAPSDAVVGLFLTPKRERALLADGLLHPLPRRGVVALAVDASAPLAPQGPWHALLHKATDQLAPHAQPGALAFTGTNTRMWLPPAAASMHAVLLNTDAAQHRTCVHHACV